MLRCGYKTEGITEIPPKTQEEIDNVYKTDKFGEIQRAKNSEDLLARLPNPKTIITDIYIADAIPEIAKTDFEAYEVRLAD